ncbi:MAG: DUF4396 domain-containing protein [Actinomycetota bacterium]|nr:DUF4396 domain-containing protein [Actinomycetota bacterium]
MEATAHSHHHDHHAPLPTSGGALNNVALSATLHCLTGCAIGEVTGMVIGTALGFSDLGTIALAVALAFLFGYSLTSLPLLRAGMALGAVVPIALATDTFSIAVMEIVDNAIMLAVPGAMESGVGDILFWGALSVALVIAGIAAFPVNRWLITKGRGHAVLHETGIHGGPPVRLVAFVVAAMAVFGTAVLIGEAVGDESGGDHGGGHAAAGNDDKEKTDMTASEHEQGGKEPDEVRGLAVADDGLKLELDATELPRARQTQLRFTVVGANGQPVRDYEVEHDKRMHLIVVRRDLTGFQHLHPELGRDGRWSTDVKIDEAGSYRVFADFKRGGQNHTLAADLAVDGPLDSRPLAPPTTTADAGDGYEVELSGAASKAGEEAELGFSVTRDGKPVEVDDYLGAKGHLVALREGDLAYLHVHPAEAGHGAKAGEAEPHGAGHEAEAPGRDPIRFMTEFPSDGRYGLFLQFKHEGKVHTAAFTREVAR